MKPTALVMGTLVLVGTLAAGTATAQVTPEDVLSAVDEMSPEQVYELYEKLDAKLWHPLPEGFFTRLGVLFSVSGTTFDKVNLSSLGLAVGGLDVDRASGAEMSLLWQCFDPRFHLGVRGGSWYSRDSDRAAAGFSRVEVEGGHLSLACTYRLVRETEWQVWAEAAVGVAGMTVDILNTPLGAASTVRELEAGMWMGDIGAGAAWRFNPVLSLFGALGYRLTEDVDLEEGGDDIGASVDASGVSGRIGISANF